MRSAEIARVTGLPYYTLLKWRKGGGKFVELAVVKSKPNLVPKVGTVTVPTLGAISILFPNGIRIEGLGPDALSAVLPSLGGWR
jgi:hypothetical protein